MSTKVNEGLARLEAAVAAHEWTNLEQLERDAADRINQLAREVQDLDIQSANERNSAEWKRRIRQLDDELTGYRRAFDDCMQRARRISDRFVRDELLGDRKSSATGLSRMDQLTDESESLTRANQMVGDQIEQGRQALENMRRQRERLSKSHEKLLDSRNLVGMGRSVIGMIQRNFQCDNWIAYACMLLTIVVFIWALWYRSRRGVA